jgi:hypothetical protein
MDTEAQNTDAAIAEQTAKPARKPRTRIPHERSQFVHALEDFARAIGAPFDAPSLPQLAAVTQDEFLAIRDRLITAFAAGIEGIGKSSVPTYDVQLDSFRTWQRQRVEYFQWDDAAMDALRRKLDQLGPNCELIPAFAYSVQIKRPNGALILVNRKGDETK